MPAARAKKARDVSDADVVERLAEVRLDGGPPLARLNEMLSQLRRTTATDAEGEEQEVVTALAASRAQAKAAESYLAVETVALTFVSLLCQRSRFGLALQQLALCRSRLEVFGTGPTATSPATLHHLNVPVDSEQQSGARCALVLAFQHRLLAVVLRGGLRRDVVNLLLERLSTDGDPFDWVEASASAGKAAAKNEAALQRAAQGIAVLAQKVAQACPDAWTAGALQIYAALLDWRRISLVGALVARDLAATDALTLTTKIIRSLPTSKAAESPLDLLARCVTRIGSTLNGSAHEQPVADLLSAVATHTALAAHRKHAFAGAIAAQSSASALGAALAGAIAACEAEDVPQLILAIGSATQGMTASGSLSGSAEELADRLLRRLARMLRRHGEDSTLARCALSHLIAQLAPRQRSLSTPSCKAMLDCVACLVGALHRSRERDGPLADDLAGVLRSLQALVVQDPAVDARIRSSLGGLQFNLARLLAPERRALSLLQGCLELLRECTTDVETWRLVFDASRLLGSCLQQQHDHEAACLAYQRAIVAYVQLPVHATALCDAAARLEQVSGLEAEHKSLCDAVSRSTLIELMDRRRRPEELSLARCLASAECGINLTALLLEYQLFSLKASSNRTFARLAAPAMLKTALDHCDRSGYPLHRARCTLTAMHLANCFSEKTKTDLAQAAMKDLKAARQKQSVQTRLEVIDLYELQLEMHIVIAAEMLPEPEALQAFLDHFQQLVPVKTSLSISLQREDQDASTADARRTPSPPVGSTTIASPPRPLDVASSDLLDLFSTICDLADLAGHESLHQQCLCALRHKATALHNLEIVDSATERLAAFRVSLDDWHGSAVLLAQVTTQRSISGDFLLVCALAGQGRLEEATSAYSSARARWIERKEQTGKNETAIVRSERLQDAMLGALAYGALVERSAGLQHQAIGALSHAVRLGERCLAIIVRQQSAAGNDASERGPKVAEDVFAPAADAPAAPAPSGTAPGPASWRSLMTLFRARLRLISALDRRGQPRHALKLLSSTADMFTCFGDRLPWRKHLTALAAVVEARISPLHGPVAASNVAEPYEGTDRDGALFAFALALRERDEHRAIQLARQALRMWRSWADGLRLNGPNSAATHQNQSPGELLEECGTAQEIAALLPESPRRHGTSNGTVVKKIQPSPPEFPSKRAAAGLKRSMVSAPSPAMITQLEQLAKTQTLIETLRSWRAFLVDYADLPLLALMSQSTLCPLVLPSDGKAGNDAAHRKARAIILEAGQGYRPALLKAHATGQAHDLSCWAVASAARSVIQIFDTAAMLHSALSGPRELLSWTDLSIAARLSNDFADSAAARLQPLPVHSDLLPAFDTPHSSPNGKSASDQLASGSSPVVLLQVVNGGRALRIVRHDPSSTLLVTLPFDRDGTRAADEEGLSLDAALQELEDIVTIANETAQRGKAVKAAEDRRAWWKQRKEADERLRILLELIECKWLGVFKTFFAAPRSYPKSALAAFRKSVEAILSSSAAHGTRTPRSFNLDPAYLAALGALPDDADNDDLEDWMHSLLDALHIAGHHVPADEIDFDQACALLRQALEVLHAAPGGSSSPSSQHLYLVVDATLAKIPWESLSCLRHRSVSRLPSSCTPRLASQSFETPPRARDARPKVTVVLDPAGDLKHTRGTFDDMLKADARSHWHVIAGRAPLELEMQNALRDGDVFLFLGHGGAEQYVRRQTLLSLPRCATVMLWGCSSGAIDDQGQYGYTCTPMDYLCAGAPAVVATLWDVTDKDIDRCTTVTLEQWGLTADNGGLARDGHLGEALATGREACTLRYLNGAAAVMYGRA